MQLTQDSTPEVNLIRSYGVGELWIAERRFTAPCLVGRQLLDAELLPPSLDQLTPDHVSAVIELKPEMVITGTRTDERFPSSAIRRLFNAAGLALEPMEFGAACRTYNVLVQDGRAPIALLFP